MMNLALKTRNLVYNDELCIKNEEMCINDEFCTDIGWIPTHVSKGDSAENCLIVTGDFSAGCAGCEGCQYWTCNINAIFCQTFYRQCRHDGEFPLKMLIFY